MQSGGMSNDEIESENQPTKFSRCFRSFRSCFRQIFVFTKSDVSLNYVCLFFSVLDSACFKTIVSKKGFACH